MPKDSGRGALSTSYFLQAGATNGRLILKWTYRQSHGLVHSPLIPICKTLSCDLVWQVSSHDQAAVGVTWLASNEVRAQWLNTSMHVVQAVGIRRSVLIDCSVTVLFLVVSTLRSAAEKWRLGRPEGLKLTILPAHNFHWPGNS